MSDAEGEAPAAAGSPAVQEEGALVTTEARSPGGLLSLPDPSQGKPSRPPGWTTGLVALPRGARFLLAHPRLWPLVALPLVINVLIFTTLGYLAFTHVLPWIVAGLTPEHLPWWLSWVERFLLPVLSWAIWLFSVLVMMLMGAVSFTSVGCIVSAPFLDQLSDRVEDRLLGCSLAQPFSWSALVADLGRTVWQALVKLLFVAFAFVMTLPLLIIPVFGQLAFSLIQLYIASWYLAVEFVDLPMARAGWSVRDRHAWLKARQTTMLGFGASVYLVCLVPLAGFLVLPAATAAGALLFIETSDEDQLPVSTAPPPPSA